MLQVAEFILAHMWLVTQPIDPQDRTHPDRHQVPTVRAVCSGFVRELNVSS